MGLGDEAWAIRAGPLLEELEPAALRAFLAFPTDDLLLEPAGALIAHELPRLDGPPQMMLYSIDTEPPHRRRGVA